MKTFRSIPLISNGQGSKNNPNRRSRVSLAEMLRDQSRRTAARDLLAPVYDWFTEGFDTPDLNEAKALLDTLN